MDELVIPGLDQEDIGTLLNTRTYPQYCEMVKKIQRKECPFCQLDTELNKVILEKVRWRAWENPFQQRGAARHVIIAHRRHITHLREVNYADGKDLFDILHALSLSHDVVGGGVLMRFGDPRYNSGSIRHLHVNLFVPDGTDELRLPLCKKPEDIADKMRVIRVFEKMRTSTPFEKLGLAEQDLVRDRMKAK